MYNCFVLAVLLRQRGDRRCLRFAYISSGRKEMAQEAAFESWGVMDAPQAAIETARGL